MICASVNLLSAEVFDAQFLGDGRLGRAVCAVADCAVLNEQFLGWAGRLCLFGPGGHSQQRHGKDAAQALTETLAALDL